MGLGEDLQVLVFRAPPLFAVRLPRLWPDVLMLTSDICTDDCVDLPTGGPRCAKGVEGCCASGQLGRQ